MISHWVSWSQLLGRHPQSKQWIQQNVWYFYAASCACAALLLRTLHRVIMPDSLFGATIGRTVYGLFNVSLLVILLANPGPLFASFFARVP